LSTSDHFSALPTGARIRDYAVERVLGSGSFGITYRAVEAFTERVVAIKEYLPAALAARDRDGHSVRPLSEGSREDFAWGLGRFRQEAKVLIGLKHPNIVPVLSYFEANGTGYLVMEFQEGRSLGQTLGQNRSLTEGEALRWLHPLLDGLEAVHGAGFLHRDIKPDNIFIRSDGSPVLIDFGAARQALGQHSKSLTAILTEGYAPYEQYERDGNQGPWTDIYAVGAVVFRCLLGRRPIDAPKRLAARVRNAPDPIAADLAALRGVASPEICRGVAAALAVTEGERPQSVAAFRALLAAASAVEGEHTLVPGPVAAGHSSAPRSPALRRRPLPIYVAIGALLIAGAATAGYFTLGGGEHSRRQAEAAAAAQREAEAERKRAEEQRVKEEAEAERRAAEERRAKEEADRRRADEERAKAEAESKRKAEEERRAKEEADRRRVEDVEAKRKAEQEAARKAGPATNAATQLQLFKSILERVLSSYVDEVTDKRVITAAIETLFATVGAAASPTDRWRGDLQRATNAQAAFKVFEFEFTRVHASHAGRFGGSRLIHKVIAGMLSALDPHSSFMDAAAFKEMQVQTRGEFGGVGMEITLERGLVKVVAAIDNTPAARAGLRAGDLITHIEGEAVNGWTLKEVVDKLRGAPHTNVLLRIRRGERETFDVTLTRAIITITPVRARVEGNVGIIRITSFSERTESGVRDALAGFKRQLGAKWAGVVLDLRNNPGGLLNQAIAVTDEFLDQGEIVSTRGRGDKVTSRHNAKAGDGAEGRPLIILINKGSASASEIVAGALQDHRRATVLGTPSFGKGTVQTIIPLPDQGALRLTTARFVRPSGQTIDKVGIKPDLALDGDPAKTPDGQMERALKWIAERRR
jgi:carboxyl-terminal processing protease